MTNENWRIEKTENPAVTFDKLSLDRDGDWQIIFRNAQGIDYCRETKIGTMPREDVLAFAARTCATHPHVRSAHIERW